MVRPRTLATHFGEITFPPIPLAIGMFVSASLLVVLCAKHGRQVARRHASEKNDPNTPKPPSPSPSPRRLITTISDKTLTPPPSHAKNSYPELGFGVGGSNKGEEESGLWQKAILMGEKCRPPEFSGVIYYDYSGNRVPEMPRSPRASPLRDFTFPVKITDKTVY